ncbi:MAG TPA: DUF4446 family protein [Candidatus Paceibacterota bacterium]|nr:DUF4446 family protein [Candidatus Paceibacterota bacterium]
MILDSNILIGVLALCSLCLVADVFHLRWTLRKVFKSKDCNDIGSAIASCNKDIDGLEKFRADIEAYMKNVERRLRRSTQATETVRFNAFRGDGLGGTTGGGQSFATAFINEDGDGAVLSSIFTRERVSVYSKPVVKFESDNQLTEEERRAVSLAKAKLGTRA